jgi:membrane-associated phospholipid phosphatase
VFISFQLMRAPGTTAQFVKAFVTLIAAGTIVHWLYPTVYPRDLYPCPVGIDPITRATLDAFRVVDAPASCLPSLHVAASYLAVFACWSQARRGRWMLLGWATGIAAATLTVKQHYVVDLLAGVALAGAVWFVFYRWLPRIHRGVVRVPELSWARTKD